MFKNSFNKLIIFFFYFFLLSRFFSEKLKILPKYIDVINYALFVLLLILLILNINRKALLDFGENATIFRLFAIFLIFFSFSIIFNSQRILFAASMLFLAGFMEGPILFLSLNKLSNDPYKLVRSINKLFLVILVLNLIIIIIVDIPVFLLTGNPDLISGTYGNNTYQFSMLLIICGGYLLGYNKVKNRKLLITISSQIIILLVFYLTQFRSGLPFFLLSYTIMVGFLYGRKIVLKIVPIVGFSILLILIIVTLTRQEKAVSGLKFEDWMEIISEPTRFLDYGKFKIYQNTAEMFVNNPETVIIGTGPGNFLSRANYAFSYELYNKTKGVSGIISSVFGINYPYFSDYHIYYVYNRIRQEAVLGTWQLANPYTSYLASITEIGIIGGASVVLMYIFLILKSFVYIRKLKENNTEYLPLAIALIGSATFLFQLAFLDNYWEQARVTLPVWLLFWAVKTAVHSKDESENTNHNITSNE